MSAHPFEASFHYEAIYTGFATAHPQIDLTKPMMQSAEFQKAWPHCFATCKLMLLKITLQCAAADPATLLPPRSSILSLCCGEY
jgi:hypothetical protein